MDTQPLLSPLLSRASGYRAARARFFSRRDCCSSSRFGWAVLPVHQAHPKTGESGMLLAQLLEVEPHPVHAPPGLKAAGHQPGSQIVRAGRIDGPADHQFPGLAVPVVGENGVELFPGVGSLQPRVGGSAGATARLSGSWDGRTASSASSARRTRTASGPVVTIGSPPGRATPRC